MSPAPKKTRKPAYDQAIGNVVACHAEVEASRSSLEDALARRREAVRVAIDAGATLRDLGALMEMSPEGVAKLVR
jgi:hypothetical protein